MISLLDLGPHIVAYRAGGALERADVERLFVEVDRKLAAPARIRVYGEIHPLTGVSVAAVWEEVKQSLQRWRVLGRIEKAALVTDLTWLQRGALGEDLVFRGIHLRIFPLARQVEAQRWVRY